MRALFLAFLAWPGVALATDGLVWKMPPEGRRFHLMTRIADPYPLTITVERAEIRVWQLAAEVVTRCVPTEATRSGWKLDCTIEDAMLDVITEDSPTLPESGALPPVPEGWPTSRP